MLKYLKFELVIDKSKQRFEEEQPKGFTIVYLYSLLV